MKTIGKIVGAVMWISAGILMFIFELAAMIKWFGFLGIILSFVFMPGVVVFPIVFWIVEGVFPTFYFMIWLIGIVGMIIFGISMER